MINAPHNKFFIYRSSTSLVYYIGRKCLTSWWCVTTFLMLLNWVFTFGAPSIWQCQNPEEPNSDSKMYYLSSPTAGMFHGSGWLLSSTWTMHWSWVMSSGAIINFYAMAVTSEGITLLYPYSSSNFALSTVSKKSY